MTEYLLWQGTESHSDANLAAALADSVSEHAIGADSGQQQRHHREGPGQHGGRTAGNKTVIDQRLHGLDVVHRKSGIDCEDGLAKDDGERRRIQ